MTELSALVLHSYGGAVAENISGWLTAVERSAAGGPQVVQHSCVGTAVLHNMCGSAAVAKLQLP